MRKAGRSSGQEALHICCLFDQDFQAANLPEGKYIRAPPSTAKNVRIQDPSKRPSSGRLYPVFSIKECYRKGGKCKISRVLQSPVSSPQAAPKVEASNRLKQTQHFSACRKVQNGNFRVHQDLPGEWVSPIDLSDAYLHIPIHPNSRKYLRFCHRSQVFQFTSLPFRLATAP